MKVEFLDSDIYGAELFIPGSEFLKAEKDDLEYNSLIYATDAFAKFFGADFSMTRPSYDAVCRFLEKNGNVIFTISENQYEDTRWCEIIVIGNNQAIKVFGKDENGDTFLRVPPKGSGASKKGNTRK